MEKHEDNHSTEYRVGAFNRLPLIWVYVAPMCRYLGSIEIRDLSRCIEFGEEPEGWLLKLWLNAKP